MGGTDNPDSICQKWIFEGYIYLGISFDPEPSEIGDFLHLNCDGTYADKDEGVEGTGEWKLENDIIQLMSEGESIDAEVIVINDTELIIEFQEGWTSIQMKFKANTN